MRSLTLIALLLLLSVASPVLAQSGATYAIDEGVLNLGGHPAAGQWAGSTNYETTLVSIGEGFVGRASSATYDLTSGFPESFGPVGEVLNVRWLDNAAFEWDVESRARDYNLYRGLLSEVNKFGECHAQGLGSTMYEDSDAVPQDDGFIYLVTAVNRLDEEGTRGWKSDGTERPGNVCP